MGGVDLTIAIGQDEQAVAHPDAPPEVLDQIERRFVRPMHILDHENGRSQLP